MSNTPPPPEAHPPPLRQSLIRRGFSSLRELGLRRSFETVLSHCEDLLFDFSNLTETYARVHQSELRVDSPNQAEAAPYFPTRGRAFRKALEHFAIPAEGGFVDLGSGKGKLLILAAQYGFRRVLGVEFAAELNQIAIRNLDAVRTRLNGAMVQSLCIDAAEYQFQPDEQMFFMFAPFHENVMRRVMSNLQRSIDEHPREIRLLYTLPRLIHIVTQDLHVQEQGRYQYGGHEFVLLGNGPR